MTAWRDGTTLARSHAAIEDAVRTSFGVVLMKDYATGDGSDESVDVQAALDAAGSTRVLSSETGKTYVCATTLVAPDGLTWEGNDSTIDGVVSWGPNSRIWNLGFGDTGRKGTIRGGTTNTRFYNCDLFGGDASACLYLNDSNVQDVKFYGGSISGNTSGGNGVQIVDKGTVLKHYEDIEFDGVRFYANDRMNFECIQRSDVGFPVVQGYRNINLKRCKLVKAPGGINVSYDAGLLADGTDRSSGYSSVIDCDIEGGTYCVELAGPTSMKIQGGSIRNADTMLLSMSQYSVGDRAKAKISGVNFSSTASVNVTLAGRSNSFIGNHLLTAGALRLAGCGYSIVNGNDIECTGLTAISVENSPYNTFTGNIVRGGSNQTFLFIYTGTFFNRVDGNILHHANTLFDVRDGTVQHIGRNTRILGGNTYQSEDGGSSVSTPGAVTTLSIPHGIGYAPTRCSVVAGDANARAAPAFYVTMTSTNIVLNFSSALAAATSYTWLWSAVRSV